jgi:pyruvate formate lyase activating enzyme
MGKIINVTRFCTDDGPGIRTTVFFKGCPLRCIWCHNPESQRADRELMISYEKCSLCGVCEAACKGLAHKISDTGHVLLRQNCILCGECVTSCPSSAIEISGKDCSADEIIKETLSDKVFYETSGGGMTLSGGEILYQPDFAAELLSLARAEGIHTAIETSGFGRKEDVKRLIPLCDTVLFDIKETDEERHKEYTGVGLSVILENLTVADSFGVPIVLRLPIIPGLNDREEHFLAVKKIAAGLKNLLRVEVMPYHALGEYKYRQLDREYKCSEVTEPTEEQKAVWQKFFDDVNGD